MLHNAIKKSKQHTKVITQI